MSSQNTYILLQAQKEVICFNQDLPFRAVPPGMGGTYQSDSLPAGVRQRLVFLRCDEATPHSPVGRRGIASSFFVGTRRCLVLLLEGEAAPRLPVLV
ncbi:hypothetical protein BHE74_00040480 [Ensete ventricosum]|nr:hypothetical protein BHE74_00040480 [Ensete ventricosum]